MARRFDRGRMISKSILTSGDLVDLPIWQRWLWMGLILMADNAGLVRHNLSTFRSVILLGTRISPTQIEQALSTFQTRNMLSSRTLGDVSYWQITNFSAGQRLKDRETPLEREREREDEREREREGITHAPDPSIPRGGGEAVERLRLRLEGRYEPVVHSLLSEIGRWGPCAPPKAESIFLKLREPKAEALAAWRRYAEAHGQPSALAACQNFSHPDEVPPEPKGKTFAQDREAQTEEAENRKRAMDLEAQQARRAEAAARRDKTRPEELSVMLEKFKEKLR